MPPSPTSPTNASSTSSSSSGAAASSGSSDSFKHGVNTTSSAGLDPAMLLGESTPSPAPVTRARAVTRAPTVTADSTESLDEVTDVSQTELTSSEASSFDTATPSPAPVTRSPLSRTVTMPPSSSLLDSVATVAPADPNNIDSAKAEAVTQRTDSDSKDTTDNDNHMVLLGDTGTALVYSDGNKVTTFEKYDRNEGGLRTLKDGIDSFNNTVVGGGNRSNLPPGASISLSSTLQQTQNALLYTSCALGIVSSVLLVFFHLLALQRPPWRDGSVDGSEQGGGNSRANTGWLTPNVWELAVVVGYIQHINSISMLDLTKAPQIVLDFTDSFSFANLHLSSVAATAVSGVSRRLQLIILTGVVAFSDRIGIDEDEALMTSFWFFLAIVAVVVVLFAMAAGFVFYRHRMSPSAWSPFATDLRSSFAMCVVGLGVTMWFLCIFPLVVMSSFELVMEMRYRVGSGLAVALFCLWAVVSGGLCYVFVSVRAIPMNEAFRFKHFAVWGSLYGGSRKLFRYFFVVTAIFQIFLGVVTGAVSGVPTQLVSLMVTHLLFVVVAVIIRPFTTQWMLGVVVGLRVVAIANLLCSFAFLTSSEMTTYWRGIVAQGFVAFNAIVFILFFIRYIAMFILALKRWSGFIRRDSTIHSQESYDIDIWTTRSRNDHAAIY
uniref:TRP C-terminal domain-containing protein n=1 Tax=Hyaloperonospora arabidopsidis (strain Emoy2) TaxID=559515 RepID=M4C302_HYAAE